MEYNSIMKPLYKTTIVIWSENQNKTLVELSDLAWEATQGADYCSKMSETFVFEPTDDEDWDGTEFFNTDE